MQKKIIKSLFISTLVAGVLVSSAMAAHRAGAIGINPGFGFFRFSHKQALKNNVAPNLGLSYDFNSAWSTELFWARFNTKRSRSEGGASRTVGNVYSLNGIYHFRAGKSFEPMLIAGLGATKINHPAGTNPDVLAHVTGGAGLEYFMTESMNVRASLSDFYTMSGGKNDLFANVGLSFLFLGKQAAQQRDAQAQQETAAPAAPLPQHAVALPPAVPHQPKAPAARPAVGS